MIGVSPVAPRLELLSSAVTAPPVDGKANAALCALIAEAAGVPRSAVQVVRGASGRDKVVRVEGVDEPTLRAALGV